MYILGLCVCYGMNFLKQRHLKKLAAGRAILYRTMATTTRIRAPHSTGPAEEGDLFGSGLY